MLNQRPFSTISVDNLEDNLVKLELSYCST